MSIRPRFSLLAKCGFWIALSSFGTVFGQEPASPSVQGHPLGEESRRLPKHFADGSDLPNGWRVTPVGKAITGGDGRPGVEHYSRRPTARLLSRLVRVICLTPSTSSMRRRRRRFSISS